MKILHVISELDPRAGGPAVALAGLTKAQAAAGLDVEVVATTRNDVNAPNPPTPVPALAAAQDLRAAGVNVTVVGPARGALARHPDLAAAVDRAVARAGIVHVHALWEEIQHRAARAAVRLRRPYIVRPCGMLDPWSLDQSRWKKRLYRLWRLNRDLRQAAALHFTSQTERDLTAPLKLRPPALVVPNGVDLSEFQSLPRRGTFRARFPELGDRPIVLFLSRLHPKKGLDLLVPAFARAAAGATSAAARDAVLVIAGPDSDGYRAKVEDLVKREKLFGRVLFPGMLYGPDRVAALADADLFCLPSYQENFGVAVVEALAASCPVVISDQVNIWREIVDAGAGAALPARVEPLAEALRTWLADADLRRRAADKARPFVWEHYDWAKIARRWVDAYRDLAAARPA